MEVPWRSDMCSCSSLCLTWAGATAAGASSSLSDSSLLLLSESSSGFPAWVAADPVFPGGARAATFPGVPLMEAEAALTWGGFPEVFAWIERDRMREGSPECADTQETENAAVLWAGGWGPRHSWYSWQREKHREALCCPPGLT